MKALKIFFGSSVAIVLLGGGLAMGDIRTDSIKPLMFSVSTEDGSVTMPDFSFCDVDSVNGEEAQTTCMSNPGGSGQGLLMDLPVVPPGTPERTERYTSAEAAIDPISPLRSPEIPNERRPRNPDGRNPGGGIVPEPEPEDPEPEEPTPPPYVIPEPATLAIVGLGIGGLALVRRWRRG